jgi:predicted dehydrogenase
MNNQYLPKTAIVGCGKGGPGVGAHSIGYRHAEAYSKMGYPIVGACDLNADNLSNFVEKYEVPHFSEDLKTMLEVSEPELVSICTYVGSHLPIFQMCVEAGVRAIFLEKPLCLTKADGLAMLGLADQHGTKVVVNHYRRYLPRFLKTKRLIDAGAIGDPVFYVAGIDDWDLMEWGTHWLDMFRFLSGDQEVEWVMGQAEVTERKGYGHVMEDHALAYFSFTDGSKGLLDGGCGFKGEKAMRIVGTRGIIEIPEREPASYLNADGRTEFAQGTNIHYDDNDAAWLNLLADLASWCDGGAKPQCCLENALKSSELYLAAYESALQRGRIVPPLNRLQKTFALDLLRKS